jgi:uncharacterized protein (DUF58 family)
MSAGSILARIRVRDPLWSVYPAPRFAALVLGVGMLWLAPRVGVLAGLAGIGALAAAVVFDYMRLPGMRNVRVERRMPDVMGLGDPQSIVYELVSEWAWPVRVRLFDALPPGIRGELSDGPIELPGRTTLEIEVPITAIRRRKQLFSGPTLRIATPIGLLTRLVRFAAPAEVVVVPSLTNVRRFRILAMQHRLSDAGVRALKLRGEGSAFSGVREYVPGDDPRLVDWKSTARHSRLIVREQTIERSQTVICMVDCGRAMTQLAGAYSRFEHVLSAALVLADVASTSGDRVGLIAFDDAVRSFVAPQKGSAALRVLRTSLNSLDATMSEPDYATAFRLLATRQRRRALVVFFTDVVDVRVARTFAAFAGRSAQRHMLVVVAIQNAELIASARPDTSGALALFRSAAAEELVREREEALGRMRSAGVTVLDVTPDRMAAAVINRYLEIKAHGLL